MSETLAHHQPASHDIVNLAAAALSAAPDLTETERTARFQAVVRGTMEFHPADPTQTTLATLILGHHLAIMDGFRDIACLTLTPAEAAKARMVAVAQTKVVLQLARELRIARKEAQAQTAADRRAAEAREPAASPVPRSTGDAGTEDPLTKLFASYTETLATLENAGTPTLAAAATASQALSQVLPLVLAATPKEANAVSVPLTGSRAQRRAMMKRMGQFKRHA